VSASNYGCEASCRSIFSCKRSHHSPRRTLTQCLEPQLWNDQLQSGAFQASCQFRRCRRHPSSGPCTPLYATGTPPLQQVIHDKYPFIDMQMLRRHFDNPKRTEAGNRISNGGLYDTLICSTDNARDWFSVGKSHVVSAANLLA
jgi:hypothetical protein